ncbi:MAG: Crp/Fnr family transcriptional regulator [Oscillospiraceae bacterium]|nr:Crp/Fnr family transcriptional regulator [Oscillospiraceae bacterium]
MKQYIPVLQKTQLFSGIGEEETEAMLNCLQARLRSYKKGEFVLRQGERLDKIMVLAEGKLHIQRDDHWGNRSIINMISPSEMFGEAFAAPESGAILNDVLAVEDSVVLLFDVNRIITVCPSACRYHSKVVQNLFCAISEKNRKLVQKLGYMSERTTRGKLIAYLSDEAKRHNSSEFTIPFNRQQLADYLSVDRSAMSAELCRMRDEGLLKFQKNRFVLL